MIISTVLANQVQFSSPRTESSISGNLPPVAKKNLAGWITHHYNIGPNHNNVIFRRKRCAALWIRRPHAQNVFILGICHNDRPFSDKLNRILQI
jgi:hypothetical protein